VALLATGAAAADLPLVDTHLHYSRNSWDEYAPDAILGLLDRAGIRRAFVSSTPDEGTVRLHQAAPDRIVPVLRPYREAGELGTWHRDPSVVGYLEARLGRGIYRGIGEFHLGGEEARSAVVRQVAELARRHGSSTATATPRRRRSWSAWRRPARLWAHAGCRPVPTWWAGCSPAIPHRELALRADVAPGGRPAWRALFWVTPTASWSAPTPDPSAGGAAGRPGRDAGLARSASARRAARIASGTPSGPAAGR
jgi:hypothetical protein